MTDLVLLHTGSVDMLDELLADSEIWVHLYTADHAPDPCSDRVSLREADWPDYAAQRATGWTPAELVAGRAVSYADPLLWVRGTGGPGRRVYGYYTTRTQSGPLWWAEWGGDPRGIPMVAPNDHVAVWPSLRLAGEYAPMCVSRGGVVVEGEHFGAQ